MAKPNRAFPIVNRGPLEGVVVLDFTTQLSGPLATHHLGGLGATVIKIEEPKGDRVRSYPPFISPDGKLTAGREHPDAMSLPMLNRNRGKHSVTLNLKAPEATILYREMVARADVVIENYASGTADSLGIGYEATRAINPAIVYCSLSGFGVGEMPGRKAMDTVIQAMSGMMLTSGEEGDAPVRIGITLADSVAPLFAVMGINAALYRRQRTGEGEHVDISMLGALTSLLAVEDWQATEQLGGKTRTGNSLSRAAPFGVYRCRDGHIAISAGGQEHFTHALFRIMGRPEMVKDPCYATQLARSQRDEELTEIINAWSSSLLVDEVEAMLLRESIPTAKVRSPADAVEDPVVNRRREVVDVEHPDGGIAPGLKTYGLATRLRQSTYGQGAPAPKLGQDNAFVYGDWLGFDARQLAVWRDAGVF